MMKKILILISKGNEQREKFTSLLQKYLNNKAKVRLALLSDISIAIEEGKVEVFLDGENIKNFDLVYFRSTKDFTELAKTLGILLDFIGVKYIDSFWGRNSALGDKITSISKLAINGLPIPPTLYCSLMNTEIVEKFIEKSGLPLIAKELSLQALKGIYVVKSMDDLKKLPPVGANGRKYKYLFQKFIDIDSEYRLLVLGDKVEIVHTKVKRDYQKDKVTDLDWNSQIEFVDPDKIPDNLKKLAVKSSKVLGLEIAGVDIAVEKVTNKPWLIEVNRGPGFEYDSDGDPEIQKVAQFLDKEANT